MSKKQNTELTLIDTETGLIIKKANKTIAEIKEEDGSFVVYLSGKEVQSARTMDLAIEEGIKAYHLSV